MPTGTPYEIDVWEQPPISNVSDLSASLGTDWVHADADDPQVQAEPGVSMSEAVPLPDGETAAVDLPLGKISWFYVPVELGERLQVLVETADGGSIAGAGFEARILSPLGGLIDEVDPTTIMPATRSTNLAAGPGMVSTVTLRGRSAPSLLRTTPSIPATPTTSRSRVRPGTTWWPSTPRSCPDHR